MREIEIIEKYRRVYYFARRISKAVTAITREEEEILVEAAD